jgi:hypothetical protein
MVNVIIAIYLGYGQTNSSRSPLRSVYVWLIWLELLVSFLMSLECYLHLLKFIRPSKFRTPLITYARSNDFLGFAFYFTICESAADLEAHANGIFYATMLIPRSILVVYSSTAVTSDHHQQNPNHCPR